MHVSKVSVHSAGLCDDLCAVTHGRRQRTRGHKSHKWGRISFFDHQPTPQMTSVPAMMTLINS